MAIKPTALYSVLVQDLLDSQISVKNSVESCISSQEAACVLMRSSFLKKFEEFDQSERTVADNLAINKFLAINHRCETWRRDHRDTLYLDGLVGYFKDEIHRFFNPGNRFPLVSTYEEILQSARCGPGAALGSNGNDFYTKLFSSDLCSTARVLEYSYLNYFKHSPLWSDAEKFRQEHGFEYKVVPGNRLTTVPKNVDISRVIAVEPNLNMFFQLGLAEILTRRLRKVFNIDLSTQQDVNRALAYRGSLDNSLATIDLESASDSMPWGMIKCYFPADIVRLLGHMRSPECTLPDGRQVTLHMISTMGNGFTFPLQTIVFSCVVSACLRYLGPRGPLQRAGDAWSVFGDDIIVANEIVGPVVDLLEHLGFSVNMEKSFFRGPFRESCGSDYFHGQNVRGVYIKHLKELQARCSVLNQCNSWSARTGIMLPKVAKFLLKTLPDANLVPPWDNDDAGIKVPFSYLKSYKVSPQYQSIIYRRYVSKPLTIRFGDGVINHPKGVKRRIYNPSAIFLGMLNGTITSGEINIRHSVNLYRSRQAIAPNWDLSPTGSGIAPDVQWQRWESAVRFNHGL